MQRKTFLVHTLALAASLFAGAASAQAVKLTLGHGTAIDNPRHVAALKFAEVAKAKSNGRIEVTVAPAAQLGDDAAMVTALRTGALDMSANSQGAVANVVPEYAAFGMPFLFSSQAHAWKVMDGPAGKELADKSAEKGLIVLGYWDNGIRQMSNSKRPLLKPEDLKGLKMRTPPDSVTVDIMQSLGAEAQQIKFSELYVALQQGVVDGQENPLVNIVAGKLYEVQKYISLTGHKYELTPFLIGKRIVGQACRCRQEDHPGSCRGSHGAAAQAGAGGRREDGRRAQGQGRADRQVDQGPFEKATASVLAKWESGPIGPFVKKVVAAARAK